MNRLLEQEVARLTKHPVTELARVELAKRRVVDDVHKPWLAEFAFGDSVSHANERRMENEILIDAHRRRRRGTNEFRARCAVRRDGLFDQNGLTGVEQWQCCRRMLVRRHQHMGALETAG